MEDLEIGQKVKWEIGNSVCRGLYIDVIDDEFSDVRIYEKDGKKYVQTIKVITKLLVKDID